MTEKGEGKGQKPAPSGVVRALLKDAIDYAGLFPPASLSMSEAVENYAAHRRGPEAWALGRFIVPVARLAEWDEAMAPLLKRETDTSIPDEVWTLDELSLESAQSPSTLAFTDPSLTPVSPPWSLSALVGAQSAEDAQRIAEFNVRRASTARVDAVEARAATPDEIARLGGVFGESVRLFVEIPVDADVDLLVAAIAAIAARAKIRTGGTTPDAIPSASRVLRFLIACRAAKVACKATAGLHHPIRADYALTYETESARGTLFGFLNVMLTAAFLRRGLPESEALALLEERDPHAFTFDRDAVRWRAHSLSAADIAETRQAGFDSFGSCSFREPIDDLTALNLL